jgi:acetolactate synthase-1/2/3 large subunit
MTTELRSTAGNGPESELALQIARLLALAGVRESWGVSGREIVPMWSALVESLGSALPIATRHTRHENGAGFAAIGSWMQSGRPSAIFVTTGPGITNVLTSLESARAAGARFVVVSPLTPATETGRLGIQDTGLAGSFNADLYRPGRLFDMVCVLESTDQLPALAGRLAAGFAGVGGYGAHVAIPTLLQTAPTRFTAALPAHRRPAPAPSPALADEVVKLLADDPFAVMVGWGAREHADQVRRLLDLTGAPAISSPRGLGVADTHPQFLGVSGNGGSESLMDDLVRARPRRLLVLGTGLGEATSGWDGRLIPPSGLIHVDVDATVFGRAYPQADTLGVQSGIGEFLDMVLARASNLVRREPITRTADAPHPAPVARDRDVVHPRALMAAIQRVIVDRTDVPVLADASSAMFWATRYLVFDAPGRWLIEGRWGSMGFAGAAVVGAASARAGAAVAICGDASLHMQDELSTAVRYGIPAIWIVLNDSGLGIVRHGMRRNGRLLHDGDYPDTDFAAVARAKQAQAVRVTREEDLDAALEAALAAERPFVVDVVIDQSAVPPIGARAKR